MGLLQYFFVALHSNLKKKINFFRLILSTSEDLKKHSLSKNYHQNIYIYKLSLLMMKKKLSSYVLVIYSPEKSKLSNFRLHLIFIFTKQDLKVANFWLIDKKLCLDLWRHKQV